MTHTDTQFAILNSEESYRFADAHDVLTPALIVYSDYVDANIDATLRLLNDDPNRWRPHVKTAKLELVIRRMVERGVNHYKCATSLELLTTCQAGASDVLIAYPTVARQATRVGEIAREWPAVRISVLVENTSGVDCWRGTGVDLFIDINPGMNRTGIEQHRVEDIVRLATAIVNAGISLRGLHYYEGHLVEQDLKVRTTRAHAGYDQLLAIQDALTKAGIPIEEIITSGTPALPCGICYTGFRKGPFVHRVSPGTLVFGDCRSLEQLPAEYGYAPSALVLTTVVSHPAADVITCDAGHKTVSADAGVPNCLVIGHPELQPLQPSEEHLPMSVKDGAPAPEIGQKLLLVPKHVCPTINNFSQALIVRDGGIIAVEPVSARGREAPFQVKAAAF